MLSVLGVQKSHANVEGVVLAMMAVRELFFPIKLQVSPQKLMNSRRFRDHLSLALTNRLIITSKALVEFDQSWTEVVDHNQIEIVDRNLILKIDVNAEVSIECFPIASSF